MKKTEEKTKRELYYLGIFDRACEAAEQGIAGEERCVAELKKLVHAQFSTGLVISRLGNGLWELKEHAIPAIKKAAGDVLDAMEYSLYEDARVRSNAIPLKATKRSDFKKHHHRGPTQIRPRLIQEQLKVPTGICF